MCAGLYLYYILVPTFGGSQSGLRPDHVILQLAIWSREGDPVTMANYPFNDLGAVNMRTAYDG